MLQCLSLIEKDLKHIWHPCSQMKDYELFKPLEVIKANGSYIELQDGRKIIDAISSWWCKSLGHNHPRLKQAILAQIEKFEHVIFANTTNATIVALSEKLAQLTQSLNKVFYASDGSCAVDIALKMSMHARQISGDSKRNLFIALENSYHGETIGAMSVSDLGLYRDPYKPLLFNCEFLSPVPYVSGASDPLWMDCAFYWNKIESKLNALSENITAIIVEPIVQAAAGMKIYSQDFLRRLRVFTKKHNIHLIADEIMTGIGRAGKMLACEYANIEPDFLCLSKGLTSGWLPMSVVLTTQSIFDLFYDDYEHGKSFLHSHTFSGNALAASVALEVLNIMAEESICTRVNSMGEELLKHMQDIAYETQRIVNVRGMGAIVAAEIINEKNHRISFSIAQKAAELGALLRPLGNSIYWTPPLNVEKSTLIKLKEITKQVILDIS